MPRTANRDPAFAASVAVIHRAVRVAPDPAERAEARADVAQQNMTGTNGLARATAEDAATPPWI
jgi:hypothetical protein